MPSCGSGGGDEGGPASAKVSDAFFEGVVATDDGDASGTFRIVLYNPKVADKHAAGEPGSDPSKHEAQGKISILGTTAKMNGTWSEDGSYLLSGAGWSVEGRASGSSTTGTFGGPGGVTGDLAGQDLSEGRVQSFCGTFVRADDGHQGQWSVTVSETGGVDGVFSIGGTHGTTHGSANGTSISVQITGDCMGGPGEPGESCTVAGSASGGIDGGGHLQGSWSIHYEAVSIISGFTDHSSGDESGTFDSSASCEGDEQPAQNADAGCACAGTDGCYPCGICCMF